MKQYSVLDLNIDLSLPEYQPMDKDLELELIKKYRQTEDVTIKNKIVSSNFKLISSILLKDFRHQIISRNLDINILFTAGCMGVMRSVEVMDLDRIGCTSTYFYSAIKNYIFNEINRESCYVSGQFNLNREFISIVNYKRTNPDATETDILKHFNMTKSRYTHIMNICNADSGGRIFLDAKIENDDTADSRKISFMDLLSVDVYNENKLLDTKDLSMDLNEILNDTRIFPYSLSGKRKKEMIIQRFFNNKGFREIASELGVSHQAVQ